MSVKHRILYVEDEVFLGKIVKESLQSRGFEVSMVTDGARVLHAAKQFQPDAIVLDIMLPSIDGYTLAEGLRRDHPSLPIIFVSAKNQSEDVVKGFQVGGNDYMRKPFSIDELEARLHNLIARRVADESKKYSLGSYQYQPELLRLTQGEEVIHLTHRTNEVLEYLVKHRHDVISRKDLLLALWGDDSYFNSRNLDVYIKKIRDFFAEDPEVQIVTLKGVGYRLFTGES